MNVWETTLGNDLICTMNHYFCQKIKRKQYAVNAWHDDGEGIQQTLNQEFEKGAKFVDKIVAGETIVLIFEK